MSSKVANVSILDRLLSKITCYKLFAQQIFVKQDE